MDSVTMTGSTIRGTVKGRLVNCSVRTAPAGLRLPAGAYLLKAEQNAIHGAMVAIEAAPADARSAAPFKLPGGAAAVATLALPGEAAGVKLTPGSPSFESVKGAPSGSPSVSASMMTAPGAAAAKFFGTPGNVPRTSTTRLKDVVAGKHDAPASPRDPAANLGRSPRVLIASQAIGENCMVATTGFADLVDAVRGAGSVVLVVK